MIERAVKVKHDGSLYEFVVHDFPVEKCGVCGAITIGSDSDDVLGLALRRHLNLLLPEQMLAARKSLGQTQKVMASLIGCASETLSRWESGALVQSAAYDRILRAYFALPALRGFLGSLQADPSLGSVAVLDSRAVHAALDDTACATEYDAIPSSILNTDRLSVAGRQTQWMQGANQSESTRGWSSNRRSRSIFPKPTLRLVGGEQDAA